jgi:DNA modification methylase
MGQVEGLKPKDLVGIPWRVAFALQADGWYLRSDIIWHKPNPMPESVTDRPTKAHEYLFLLSKSERYYYDAEAIKEPAIYAEEARYDNGLNGHGGGVSHAGQGSSTRKFKSDKQRGHGRRHDGFNDRWDQMTKQEQCSKFRNKRSVWTVATQPYSEAHFATFPPKLIEPCILAGCPSGGLVLDPFAGSGTTLQVAQQLGRRGVGIELNPDYIKLAEKRTAQAGLAL